MKPVVAKVDLGGDSMGLGEKSMSLSQKSMSLSQKSMSLSEKAISLDEKSMFLSGKSMSLGETVNCIGGKPMRSRVKSICVAKNAIYLLALIYLTTGCSQESQHIDKPESAKISTENQVATGELKTVAVTKVAAHTLNRESKLPADLVAYRDVSIFPKVPGFVDWIGVDRGSQVKKGTLLVRMSAPELAAKTSEGQKAADAAKDAGAQAKADLEMAKQELVAAQAKAKSSADTYERMKNASKYPGIIAGNDLEIAQKTADADAANAKSLEKKCASLIFQRQSADDRFNSASHAAESNKHVQSYLRLEAPFDGTITERNVHEGSFVQPPARSDERPLLRLQQLSVLRLVVPVPEVDVDGIVLGAPVKFSVSAHPGEVFTGTVRRIGDSVDVATRTMPVELDVLNAHKRLRPGMYAEVVWPVHRSQETLFVPQTAVVKTTERTFVVRVKDGQCEWVDVRTGMSDGEQVEVFGALRDGDSVVARATDELRPGTHVETTAIDEPKRNSS